MKQSIPERGCRVSSLSSQGSSKKQLQQSERFIAAPDLLKYKLRQESGL